MTIDRLDAARRDPSSSTEPDRSVPPVVEDPRPWAYPASTVTALEDAGTLRVVDLPGQPVLSVEVTVPMPWSAEPREIEGVSVIVAATLEEGTADHDADALARAFERAGVDLGISSTEQGLMVGLECVPDRLGEALDLLVEVVARPAFPEAAVAREVRGRLFDIAQEEITPSVRAAREFATLLHGAEARAGRPGAGSAQTVERITADAVRAHHRAWVRPAVADVVVAGAVPQGVQALVQDRLIAPWAAEVRGWSETASRPEPQDRAGAERPVTRAAEGPSPEVLVVDRPGSAQTEVRLGWFGPTRHDPHGFAPYAPLAVMIGASPTSLLDAVLREEKGWTYGMRAGFRPRAGHGEFAVSGSFTTEATAEAVAETLRLLRSVDDGIDPAAAAQARDYALLTAPMRYATAQVVAHEAALLTLDGLGPEFTTRTLAELAEVDAEAMLEAWRRWSRGRWVMVLVGDAQAWSADLESQGLRLTWA